VRSLLDDLVFKINERYQPLDKTDILPEAKEWADLSFLFPICSGCEITSNFIHLLFRFCSPNAIPTRNTDDFIHFSHCDISDHKSGFIPCLRKSARSNTELLNFAVTRLSQCLRRNRTSFRRFRRKSQIVTSTTTIANIPSV
jgi:hypothetical protein